MRKIVSVITLLLMYVTAWADNTVSLSTTSGHPGDEVKLVVSLANTDEVVAAEIKIKIGNSISYVDGSASLSSVRSNGHSIAASMTNGVLSIYVYSLSNAKLKGSNGELCSVKLKLGKEPATYSLEPLVVLSDVNNKKLESISLNGKITLLSPKLVVENLSLDYGHIPIRSTYEQYVTLSNTGNEPLTISDALFSAEEFFADALPLTIDAGSSVELPIYYTPVKRGSVNETVSFFSNAVNGNRKATIQADPFSVNELHVGDASGVCDEEVTISLTMNNMEPIVGVQCAFELPEALKYVKGSFMASDHAANLNATESVVGQKVTLYLYSLNNDIIEEGDGEIGTFRLRLDGNFIQELRPTSVVLSNVTAENMVSDVYNAWVEIQSPEIDGDESLNMGSNDITKDILATYSIYNSGSVDLSINKVAFLSEGYSIQEKLPFSIEPWSSREITVKYEPTTTGSFSTTMQIYSNDPNRRMRSIAVTGSVYAPNSISLSGEGNVNKTKFTLDISMDNYSEIVAAQMDVNIPEGMTWTSGNIEKTARIEGLACSVIKITDTRYRVVLYSMNNQSITGETGKLLSLVFDCGNAELEGNSIIVDNIFLSDKKSTNLSSESMAECTITFNQSLLCDVNNDGEIDIFDVLATLSIMKGNPGTYNLKTADANEDGEIDIFDVLKILEIMKTR